MWIGEFLIIGVAVQAVIFIVEDWANYLIQWTILMLSFHTLNLVCIFLGSLSFGLYIHNDCTQGSMAWSNLPYSNYEL